MKNIATWLVTVWGLAACGSIAPDSDREGEEQEQLGNPSEVTIDATADETWVYFSLGSGKVVEPARPEQSKEWDIAFRRFHVAMNGGVSGSGGVEAALVKGIAFDAVRAPDTGYASDLPDVVSDEEPDELPQYFISTGESGWWDYSPMTHVLTPRPHVYVVRTAAGGVCKLEFLDYYNDAGSSGYPKIRFAQLVAAPGGDGDGDGDGDAGMPDAGEQPDAGPVDYETLTVDAGAFETWVYFKVGEGTVSIADPASSLD